MTRDNSPSMDSSSSSSTLSTSIFKESERVDHHYDRWFVVQSVDNDHPLSKLSPFVLDKAIRSAVGSVKTLRRLRNGDFLLEVASAVQSRTVNKLDNLAGCPVTTSPHRTLNTCKGVIRCGPLVDCDKEETLRELKPQGVKDISNITVKDGSDGRRNTNTFIVTFNTQVVPKHITVGYIRVPVSVYIPNPLRCFKCQKFGHGKNACRGRETCATCGQIGHTTSDCTSEPKCPNCNGSHSAFSKNCPKWLFEKRVQQVKAERSISFVEARRIVTAETEGRSAQGGRTAAAVVASRSSPTLPATCAVATQTDLTWPKGQKEPSVLPPPASLSSQKTTQTTTDKLSPRRNNTGHTQVSGKRVSTQSPSPDVSTSNKNSFNKPHGKPPDKGKKKPRLTRPPMSDSEIPTRNTFQSLDMDGSASE